MARDTMLIKERNGPLHSGSAHLSYGPLSGATADGRDCPLAAQS